jgi:hypothetical protein
MDATPGQRVQHGRERRDERLALAGLHLGDLSLVEHDAAHDLDVVLAHPERPLHRLAAHRKDVGGDVVEGGLDPLVLLLPTGFRQLAAALEVRMVELVVGGLVGLGDLADLVADLGEPGADLLVAERGDLGLELVGLVDDGLQASKLAVVRVDETGEESHGR